jgi:hypothetical protein
MRLSTKRWASSEDVRKVVLAALATALDDRKEEAKQKPGLTGVRAVATGAVIYTAGRAAFSGGRFIKERFGSDGRPDDDARSEDEEYEDEPRAEEEELEDEEYEDKPRAEEEELEDEEYDDEPRAEEEELEDEEYEDEPRAEEDEEPEDEEYDDEPQAEDEDELEDEDYEEPEAEEDEDDYEEEPEEEKPRIARPSRRPPRHAKRIPEDSPIAELPTRPSRSRSPVGRA